MEPSLQREGLGRHPWRPPKETEKSQCVSTCAPQVDLVTQNAVVQHVTVERLQFVGFENLLSPVIGLVQPFQRFGVVVCMA